MSDRSMFHRMETISTFPYTLSKHRTPEAAFRAIETETKRLRRQIGSHNAYYKRAVWEFRGDQYRTVYDMGPGWEPEYGEWQEA